jgi:hypothetical protein
MPKKEKKIPADPALPKTDPEMLRLLQRETFDYFLQEVDPRTGLIADKTKPGFPSSITVTGMAISVYITGVEKKFILRRDAIRRTLAILRFFNNSQQGTGKKATGYKGFYYHFLDMGTGERVWKCELSTIDTCFLIAGFLSAATYFSGSGKEETEIRKLALALYERVDWQWALNGGITLTHGWKPESGFLRYRWDSYYSEAHLLYILALASPTFPVKPEGYLQWVSTFQLKKPYDIEYLYAGPLFIHQFSHLWIDFRGIRDDFNKKTDFDYFENSRRATLIHRQYGIENPLGFEHYGLYGWGLTAGDGPGNRIMQINGRKRRFYDYIARGAPYGPDDGTISPWAVVASLPFAPEIVIETLRHAIEKLHLRHHRLYGFDASFNNTYPGKGGIPNGWVSPWRFGLNQAPVIMMIENYQTGLIWKIMRQCSHIVVGLQRAGFSGGWLAENSHFPDPAKP